MGIRPQSEGWAIPRVFWPWRTEGAHMAASVSTLVPPMACLKSDGQSFALTGSDWQFRLPA